MPRLSRKTPRPPIGDVSNPDGLYAYLLRFIEWLQVRQYSPRTIETREIYLRYFIEWCDGRGLVRPQEITKPVLERYQRYLFHYRKANGQPLSAKVQYARVGAIKAYFSWLAKQNHVLYNPASDLEMPRVRRGLPKQVLTQSEVESVLNQADVTQAQGVRDRTIMEVLYSTGMRRLEVIDLMLHDVDSERGTVMIHEGKGGKDRIIPIGERALRWLMKYRDEVRPQLSTSADTGHLFLTQHGGVFTDNGMTRLVGKYVQAAELGKGGSCHLFRHTMATLMLENGADIRYIQMMLGHKNVSTTQIYTQVSIRQLQEVHKATHPAKMKRASDEK